MQQIVVIRGRTNVVQVKLAYDASGDDFTSQIREATNKEATLIADWVVSFETDGVDGELVLTMDDSVTSEIEKSKGYMDIKRVTSGEPVPVFDEPIEVLFRDSITE